MAYQQKLQFRSKEKMDKEATIRAILKGMESIGGIYLPEEEFRIEAGKPGWEAYLIECAGVAKVKPIYK